MSEEDFLKKYNLKKAENTKDYQIDDKTLIEELKKVNKNQADYICDLICEKVELQNSIDKAIKYIEEHKVYNKGFEKYDICDLDIKNILEILKGE